MPILNVSIQGDYPIDRLKEYGELLEDRIEQLDEIKTVEIRGAQEKEIEVAVDTRKMMASQVSFDDILQTISTENTTISAGTLTVSGTLADTTDVINSGTYDVDNSDTIQSLSGSGGVELASGIILTTGDSGDDTVSGVISGAGSFTKTGSGTLTFSANNTYTGDTLISFRGTRDPGVVVDHNNAFQNTTVDYNNTNIPNANETSEPLLWFRTTAPVLGGLKGDRDLINEQSFTANAVLNIGNNNEGWPITEKLRSLYKELTHV